MDAYDNAVEQELERRPTMKLERLNVAWLAGLFEGEGWFGFYMNTPTARIQMTDKDVIERVGRLLGTKVYRSSLSEPNRKPKFHTAITGRRALGLLEAILPYMGQRRSRKIESIIEADRVHRPLANLKRSLGVKAALLKRTPEQRSAHSRLGWARRRSKKAGRRLGTSPAIDPNEQRAYFAALDTAHGGNLMTAGDIEMEEMEAA